MDAINTRTRANAILDILRDRICLLDYPPGTVLRESDLASEFNVSRTPIRRVLQQLIHGGLIESRDGVGTIVTEPGFNEVRDIYQMRIKLAQCIGYMNPRAFKQKDLESIQSLQHRAELLADNFNLVEYWKINHDQHYLIEQIIGNSALRKMWNHFYFLAARMWYRHVQSNSQGASESLVSELSEVSRAIQEDNAIALGFIQSSYIAYGLGRLEKHHVETGGSHVNRSALTG
jgi:DNA-binding GntR family transcriptional regulator